MPRAAAMVSLFVQSGKASTHPLAPSLPQEDAGKRGKKRQKSEVRRQKPEGAQPGAGLRRSAR